MRHAPIGYSYVHGELVPLPHEQEALRQLRSMRTSGFSVRRIARELDALAYRPRASRWWPSLVGRIVARLDLEGGGGLKSPPASRETPPPTIGRAS